MSSHLLNKGGAVPTDYQYFPVTGFYTCMICHVLIKAAALKLSVLRTSLQHERN